jgi:hypothetical protein
MTNESKLMGYVRRSNNGGAIKISISESSFTDARKYQSASGERYVGMIINLNKLRSLLSGEREVTSISQIVDDGKAKA